MKTKLILAASAAALLVSAGAYAQGAPQTGAAAHPQMNQTMTRAQVLAMAGRMFAKMDANSDGVINEADRAARKAERFGKLDTNKDGTVSQDEFAAKRAGRAGAAQGHEGHEMGGKRAGGGKMGGRAMLKLADANNDGSITRAEFDAAVATHFAATDTNKDGSVSPEERQAAHAKMRAMKQRSGAGQ